MTLKDGNMNKRNKIISIVALVLLLILGSLFVFKDVIEKSLVYDLTISSGSPDSSEVSVFKATGSLGILDEIMAKKTSGESQISPSDIRRRLVLKRRIIGDVEYEIGITDYSSAVISEEGSPKWYSLSKPLVNAICDNLIKAEIEENETSNRHKLIINGEEVSDRSFVHDFDPEFGYAPEQTLETEGLSPFLLTINEKALDYDFQSELPGTYTVYMDGRVLTSGTMDGDLFIPNKNGYYDYFIETSYEGEFVDTKQVSHFSLHLDLPPSYQLSKDNVEQGGFAELRIINPRVGEEPFIKSDKELGLKFSKSKGGDYVAIIPSSYSEPVGTINLTYGYEDAPQTAMIEVKPREFSIQQLTISSSVAARTRTDEAYAEFEKYYYPSLVEDLYEPESSSVHDMGFVLPSAGVLTTEYGETRHVNGAPTSYNHSGLDIAWDADTEILSTADGVVALSRDLILTGGTVVISHGHGLFSSYYHMSQIDVEEGDFVSGGSPIGYQGSTGFSTGVHLHFMISYGDINMEPGYFIYGKKVTYDNYEDLFGEKSPEALRNKD